MVVRLVDRQLGSVLISIINDSLNLLADDNSLRELRFT